MASNIQVTPIQQNDYHDLSTMVGGLLGEIMDKVNAKVFNFNQMETELRVRDLVSSGKYWIFIAKDADLDINIGFISLYESYALYAEGAYGTIPELYVRPDWRSKSVGEKLLRAANDFARSKDWYRLEVTTPPLPEFDRTLSFYQANGFTVTGGKKLKRDIRV